MAGYSGRWSPAVRKAVEAGRRARARQERDPETETERMAGDESEAVQFAERAFDKALAEIARDR